MFVVLVFILFQLVKVFYLFLVEFVGFFYKYVQQVDLGYIFGMDVEIIVNDFYVLGEDVLK